MRLIVVSLVLLNLGVFVYFQLFVSKPAKFDEPVVENISSEDNGGLVLLAELEAGDGNAELLPEDVRLERSVEIVNEAIGEPLCTLVGAFKKLLKAEYFVEKVEALGLAGEIKNLVVESEPGYWLHLQPEKSRKDALRRLSELQRRGIDSYVIPSGGLENGVSIGMFSNKSLADGMFEKVKLLGYEPKIVTVPREQKEIWVYMPTGESAKLSDESWAELLSSEEYLQKRQNVCSDLASY